MRVLVTGVAGFIGSRIASEALRRGWTVVGVDRLSDYYDRAIKVANLRKLSANQAFEFAEINLAVDPLERIDASAFDLVFHQAGQPGVRPSWGDSFDTYLSDNVRATQRLLEALRGSAVLRRFVYASSSSVYGDAVSYPTTELALPGPVSPYGVTKLAAEHLVSLYASNFGIPAVSLRYFTVYGPGQRPDMAFTRMMTLILRGEPITLYGTGTQVRDFTFIDDVVSANFAVVDNVVPSPSVFNVCGGSSVTLLESIEIIGELAGTSFEFDRRDPSVGDARRTGGTSTALRKATGWRPVINLADGLARQFEWARENHVPLTFAVER